LLLVVPVRPSEARPVIPHSYREYAEKADLIVVAQAVDRTRDTSERATLPGVAVREADDTPGPFEVIGVETRFRPLLIFKGAEGLGEFTLHHYRDKVERCGANCVSLFAFDPDAGNRTGTFLLFLVEERDGRYAPALDVTDITKSICPLPDGTFPLPPPPSRRVGG
jgi:hypothetical protein